ncbi:Ultraviolet N-glycosylase/AP lyase [Corynebacterium ciconiae DSM 44920]|uniref:endonuclease III n=1 Tax=Corynebacterium ciconiae TaxID=227319 RepID=UPI00036B5AAD|nr:endonuclease III [Corynebacterium ciconiae]WKD62199.1 Ultraviolet N-glycosylase/AP lyase [Corynebacterium ciconiae DSM 44920]
MGRTFGTTPLARTRRARKISRLLEAGYPDARCALDFSTAFELLIATVLSAQCTDKRVNEVTPRLFGRFPTPEAMAEASPEELEELIRPTGFYRNKAKAVAGIALALCEQHGGEVPGTLAELTALPGVGRKTANVVLGNAFDVPGLTVDTHFGRCVRRLELTEHEDPVKVEAVLATQLPQSEWTDFSHRIIYHGRQICHSRRAACGVCFLRKQCPSFGRVGPAEVPDARKLLRAPDGAVREHLLQLAGIEEG